MLAAILIVIGLSALIIIHELGHFMIAKYFGLLVEEFGFGIPPRLTGKKFGETLISLNWLPLGGFVKIYGEQHSEEKSGIAVERSFVHQRPWKKSLIIVAGVLMNFLLGWLLLSLVFMIGIPQSILVTDVKSNSLAQAAGFLAGDQLPDFKTVDGFIQFIDQHRGQAIDLKILRADRSLEIKVTPRLVVPQGEGNLGIAITEAGLPKTGFFSSFWEGLKLSGNLVLAIAVTIFKLLVGLFTNLGILSQVSGPVGIINAAVQSTKLGLVYFLQLLALISLNLAVFNALPIPALDGGRLLFILIEKVKGSPLRAKTESWANALGFAFLLLLILAVTVKDILTLI